MNQKTTEALIALLLALSPAEAERTATILRLILERAGDDVDTLACDVGEVIASLETLIRQKREANV